jgi:type VI secretion system protein ImpG
MPCKFRVAFDTVMQPLMIRDVQWRTPDRLNPPVRVSGSAAALRVEFKCGPDVKLDKLGLRSLRLYLNAESHLVHSAYEIICCNTMQILVRDSNPNSRKKPIILMPESVRQVGFHEDEAVIPYPRRSFFGYRFLQEYFTFPEKYFFVDITNLEPLATAGFQEGFELVFIFSPFELPDRQQQLEVGMTPKSVKINCAPIINLFPQTCEPILLTQTKPEYPIVPDVRRPVALEVFSVDEVFSSNPQTAEITNYAPFYSYRHGTIRDKLQTFWHATRRQSTRRNDEGTEVYLQLVDLSGRPMRPDFDAVTVRATCTNRDLPARLPFGNEQGDFEMEGFAQVRRVVALRKPTMTIRPPVGKGALWRLISHLSLNYLSLVSEGKESLQEILRLYEFSSSPYLQKQVAGITQLQSKRHFARIISENGIAFARGMLVRIEFDEEQFVGGGVYLFASVLEHFLGHYASMNSFSQLVASSRQRKEVLRAWPPRAGQQILI